jgi:hypothetical protein
MTDARWQAHHAALVREGIVPASVDWRRGYTLRFQERASGS